MKKNKFLCLAMSLLMGLTSIFAVGCGGAGGGFNEEIDDDKVQIYFGVNNAGWGEQFAISWGDAYEELHKNDVYQTPDGEKTGVQVLVTGDGQLGGTMNSTSDFDFDIFMVEVANYHDYKGKGDLVNLTSIVKEANPYDTEGKSIEQRMLKNQRVFFGDTETAGEEQYYALPSYEAYYSMFYDRDVWETKGLFLTDENGQVEVIDKFAYNDYKDEGLLTTGPDNKTGIIEGIDYSEDDGLPRTTEEFMLIFEAMTDRGIVEPFYFPYGGQGYINRFMMNLWTSFAGYENMERNFTYSGSEVLVKEVKADGTIVPDDKATNITPENGYELQRQASKYQALDFVYKIFNNNYATYKSGVSTKEAQKRFLLSQIDPASETARGVYGDGSWWYLEAWDVMDGHSDLYPNSGPTEKRIGILPMPKATVDAEQTVFVCNRPSIFVNSHKVGWREDIILDFLQYCLSDVGLSQYTINVNAPMSYEYNLISEYASQANYYTNSLMKTKNTCARVIPQYINGMYTIGQTPYAGDSPVSWGSEINGLDYTVPITAFAVNKITAVDYFKGLAQKNKASNWKTPEASAQA